ncbi:uncharacterized protein PV09_07474 [Verruconis gallopava]|uniref:Uncharacterized protein n=1 Tax=Verruconis gallopava TaxID=253628 RepID=A0A0D2A2G7_9PEZI|nr:uncharacterized protein PV09_07474 [Verruconis gallopava]KIW00948.1 hypothetical protein PV09_07474 [Verruconis gallopava]
MANIDSEKDGLLSRKSYDADARDVDEDDASATRESKGEESEDESNEDEDVLEDDYESTATGRSKHGIQISRGAFNLGRYREFKENEIPLKKTAKRLRKSSRRHRERLKRGEMESELLYDMEEGGQPSQSPSRSSSEEDLQRSLQVQERLDVHSIKRRNSAQRYLLHAAIILLLLSLLYGAYRATRNSRETQERLRLALPLSNGSTLFAPTTILISLDGFRADFLQRGLTPTLNKFIQEGVSPLYMMPSFPSVTFPNHYTMVTGLYPEAHGIVGNTFWDPEDQSEFYYTHPQQSLQSKWWGGEPLWLTAELQGVRAAVHMWPGSEAAIGNVPTSYVDKYNGKEDLSRKAERILQLLDLPGPDSPAAMKDNPRPQLIAAYVPNVDVDGHNYGPNSTEIRQTIRMADSMLGQIFEGLQERNLTDIVNVIVVSDHGMATTSTDRVVQLEDLLDVDDIAHVDGWPLYGIRPKDPSKTQAMYDQLKQKTKDMPHLHIYLRDKDMPERYHFSKNPRIAPLWIVPDAGWAIAPKKEFDVAKAKKEGLIYHPRGLHGYDFENSLMRAIFVARGPAFPHPAGSRVMPFQNIELYNIVCDTLGINPAPNNGTIRLPFKPVGQHTDTDAPQIETPYDPPSEGVGKDTAIVPLSSTEGPTPTLNPVEPATLLTPDPLDPTKAPKNPVQTTQPEDSHKGKLHKWWEWISSTFEDAKNKLQSMFEKEKSGGKDSA